MFFAKPKSHLGVDLGAGGVKVVELKQEKGRPILQTYGYTSGVHDVHSLFSVSENKADIDKNQKQDVDFGKAEEYAGVIKAVCNNAKIISKSATVSLPVSVVFHAIINLPILKKEDFDTVLKAEIKKLLPRPLEEMALDYQVLKELSTQRAQRVIVNAVPRELVAFYTQVFQRAGIALEALEPEPLALSRSLVGKDGGVAMVIDMGAERTNFYIIDTGIAITHHSIEMGGMKINKIMSKALNVDEAQVETLKQDLFGHIFTRDRSVESKENKLSKSDFINIFTPIIDPIMKEIGYSFELYLRQSGNENKSPERVILTGGAGFMPYLSEHISDKFNVKSYIGDPWGRVVYQEGLKPLLRQIGPRMSVAIGLALRNLV